MVEGQVADCATDLKKMGRRARGHKMVDSIQELSELSRKLNQKSDTLNETIASLNQNLTKLNIGVEAWVGNIQEGDPWYREDDDDQRFPMHEETWLGYYRFERGWELAVKTV